MPNSILASSLQNHKNLSTYETPRRLGACFGISSKTLCRYFDSGWIEGIKTLGGQRKILVKSCFELFNGKSEDEKVVDTDKGAGVYAYSRVSTYSQNNSQDLMCRELLQRVGERENIKEDDIVLIKDCASSFGPRAGLNNLISDMTEGKVKRLYCLYLDRLSRVPTLTLLIQFLASKYGTEIICLDTESSEKQEILHKELLGFLTVWTNRASAARSVKYTKFELSPDCIKELTLLYNSGLPVKKITSILNAHGHIMRRGDGKEKQLNYMKVRIFLLKNRKLLSTTMGLKEKNIDAIFSSFCEQNIVSDELGKLSIKGLYPAYVRYCKKTMKIQPREKNLIGREFRKIYNGCRVKIISGERFLCGISLKSDN